MALSMSVNKKHLKVLQALDGTKVPYLEVWFHGSRARGDNNVLSDWDYFVVIDDSEKSNYIHDN